MTPLKEPFELRTTFADYQVYSIIGQGGSGRVYGAKSEEVGDVAIKVLTHETATSDKRNRFKSEIKFLLKNTHPNIVTVLDNGISDGNVRGPFYVMPRYETSLRGLMKAGIPHDEVLSIFLRVLDGVEAAHLVNVVHRDIKPENILSDARGMKPAVADFGIARFIEQQLKETPPDRRLANFEYAAPEQRRSGARATFSADVYALGLMLNEMFTGSVPVGSGYRTINSIAGDYAYLDAVVDLMIRQSADDRPTSIAEVKRLIQRYHSETISTQRISELTETVVREGEIDDPLALAPLKLVNAEWDGSTLKLTLDHPVNAAWENAIRNQGNYTALMGKGPERFQFAGNVAMISAREDEVQPIVDHFKNWLPQAMIVYRQKLEQHLAQLAANRRAQIEQERKREEALQRVRNSIRI